MNQSALPSGTITFLFTDIAGSTKLLQRLRYQYADVLADQRAILRAAFEKWDGHEVDTQGDAFFVAFARASDSLGAAVEIQRALAAHTWPDAAPVRVRIGLHTGEATVTGSGYVGLDVHRAARICSAGHAGQILLSQTACALVERDLPEGIRLRDLGEHRLKDLRRPVHLFQLIVPGLPSDFPPPKSLDVLPNNLPVQLTSFVGREREMQRVKGLLNQARLVTLTGPGGSGKSRLSLQVAADLADAFPHGVWFVELAPVASTDYLVPTVANALQFPIDTHSSDLDPQRQLLDYLGGRSLLLVMDNFEHLVEGARLLTDMLERAPDLKLMVTSRERLNLREEWTFDVNGMSFPKNGNGASPEAYSALALFSERARQVDTSFTLTSEERRHAIRICQLVEGMPLGIELAAAWASTISCKEIAEEIKKNLDFLATSMRDMPETHRSLRAVFEHSWRLLTDQQRAGFRRLSVFRGSFQREAALAVAGVDLQLLHDFVNKSLLKRNVLGRYEMHDLLRQYAGEELKAVPAEQDDVSQRHSQYYIQLLAQRERPLEGERMREARDEIRAELGNVRVAIAWTVTHCGEEEARKALGSLAAFYRIQGYHEGADAFRGISQLLQTQGAGIEPHATRRSVLLSAMVHQSFCSSFLGSAGAEDISRECLPALRELGLRKELGVCLLNLGICAGYRGAYAESVALLEEALVLAREHQSVYEITACLLWLGWAYYEMGEYDQAGAHFQEAYKFSKQQGNRIALAFALSKLGTWADAMQAYSQAKQYHQEAQEIFVEFGDQAGQAYALSRMSLSAWGMGEYEEASQLGRAGHEHFQSIGHRWGIATSPCRIGFAELELGNWSEARKLFFEGLERAMEFGYLATAIYALIGLGSLWAREAQGERAAEVFTLALNHPITPALYRDIATRELAKLEGQMPAEVMEAAKHRGRASDLEDVVGMLLRERKGEKVSTDEAEEERRNDDENLG